VTGSVEPVVALVAGVASQAFPGDLLVVEGEHVVVRAGGRWPVLGKYRNALCHGALDAFDPGAGLAAWTRPEASVAATTAARLTLGACR
jgi:hypothetical protein